MYKDNSIIICPNDTKLQLLINNKTINNIKYMTINEFLDEFYFKYDYRTILYLVDNYNIDIDTSKMYINNLYYIDLNKKYISDKIKFLQKIKKELIDNNLLEFNNLFRSYLKDKNIYVINYPKLEKYIINDLKKYNTTFINKERKNKDYKVIRCNTMYDEIVNVLEKIIDLKRKGISLNNIYIVNYSDEYLYIIEKLFKEFNVNIDLSYKRNLLSTKTVKNYLVTHKLPEENEFNQYIIDAINDAKNKLIDIEESDNYKLFFKYLLKNTIINNKFNESVKISNLFDRNYTDDDYVFLIGFNYESVPTIYKNEDYISDDIKNEVDLFQTDYKNIRESKITIDYISNITNLNISYKINSFKDIYYESNLIDEYNMIIEDFSNNNFSYSHKYNKRMLNVYLDDYFKFGIVNNNLSILYNNYKNTYNTYSNKFTGINNDDFLNSIEKILLSYTSLNSFNQCGFKYYVNYVLKIDPFEENFTTLIGNIFHYILENCYKDNFDFNTLWDNYLIDKDLSIKEIVMLDKLKKILLKEIDIIKENDKYTDFTNRLFEKNITIKLNNDKKESYFTGKIDKIIFYKEISNTYFSIIDYKTGGFDTDLNNMKYGIGMQLAIYLYLVIKGEIFDSPICAGMYFQKVLMGNVSYGKKKYDEVLRDNLKLVGYSTSDVNILEHLDKTYENSNLIKGLKVGQNGFYKNSKIMDDEMCFDIFKYTESIIMKTLDRITKAKFDINPIVIGNDDVSCKYCKYKDLCFKNDEDIIRYPKVNDLSFLGGDDNA